MGHRSAHPDDGQIGYSTLSVSCDNDLLNKAAEKLFAVAVAGRGCVPHSLQVRACPSLTFQEP